MASRDYSPSSVHSSLQYDFAVSHQGHGVYYFIL